jgi:hypothetical protein
MAGVLRFPKLGSEKTLKFYEKPARDDDESDAEFDARVENFEAYEDVKLTVKLVSRQAARGWGFRHDAIMARDKKRVEEKKKAGAGDLFITQEALTELIELQADILKESLVRVSGLEYGGVDLGSIQDVGEVIRILSDIDHLAPAAAAASRAQSPTPDQVKN